MRFELANFQVSRNGMSNGRFEGLWTLRQAKYEWNKSTLNVDVQSQPKLGVQSSNYDQHFKFKHDL